MRYPILVLISLLTYSQAANTASACNFTATLAFFDSLFDSSMSPQHRMHKRVRGMEAHPKTDTFEANTGSYAHDTQGIVPSSSDLTEVISGTLRNLRAIQDVPASEEDAAAGNAVAEGSLAKMLSNLLLVHDADTLNAWYRTYKSALLSLASPVRSNAEEWTHQLEPVLTEKFDPLDSAVPTHIHPNAEWVSELLQHLYEMGGKAYVEAFQKNALDFLGALQKYQPKTAGS